MQPKSLIQLLTDAGMTPLDIDAILEHRDTETLSSAVLRKEAILGWWTSSAIPLRFKRLINTSMLSTQEDALTSYNAAYAIDVLADAGQLTGKAAHTFLCRSSGIDSESIEDHIYLADNEDPATVLYIEKVLSDMGDTSGQ